MKTVTTNSDLVKIYDYNTLTDNDLKEIRKYFEERKLVVIDNFQSNETMEYINKNMNISAEPIRSWETDKAKDYAKYKKLKKCKNGDQLINILKCKNDSKNEKWEKVKENKKLLRNIESNIFSFVNDKLNYKIENQKYDYRFTNTIKENLHFDEFKPYFGDNGFLRVFSNLDSKEYRIWNSSLNIFEYIDQKKNEICKVAKDKEINLTYSGSEISRINHFICNFILKSNNYFNDDCDKIFLDNNIPKITVKFAPGSIWICDSIINSHQIIYGNKCLSANYEINPNSFNSLDNIYKNKITPIIDEINKKNN